MKKFIFVSLFVAFAVGGIALIGIVKYGESLQRNVALRNYPKLDLNDPYAQEKALWGGEEAYQAHLRQKAAASTRTVSVVSFEGDEHEGEVKEEPTSLDQEYQNEEESLEDQDGMLKLILRSSLSEVEAIINRSPDIAGDLPGKKGGLSQRWGRSLLPVPDIIKLSYGEYEFFPNSSYTVWAYDKGKYYKTVGLYSIQGNKLYLYDVGTVEGKDPLLGRRTGTFEGSDSFSFDLRWQFVKDRVWNKDLKNPRYVDGMGRPRNDRMIGEGKSRQSGSRDDECSKNLKEARELYGSFTEEQMKGDVGSLIPNRLLGCPVHDESYIFNSKTRSVECRGGR